MKKLEVNQMENLEGGSKCSRFLSGSDNDYNSCVFCAGIGGAAAGSLFGPAGTLSGWGTGVIAGLFSC
jgi:hypothetical protein